MCKIHILHDFCIGIHLLSTIHDNIRWNSAFAAFVCSGITSLSTLPVISRWCLVVTGSSMLTFIVLPHCGIRSQTLLPDTTSSHIILTSEPPVLALPSKIHVPNREQLVPLLTTLVCRGPGSNPVPPDRGADTLPTELPRPVFAAFDVKCKGREVRGLTFSDNAFWPNVK